MAEKVDLVVAGGGIVGLATARAVVRSRPGTRVVVLEKESQLASHQSGHNSGVIHSGIYYPPGSLKARFAIAGSHSIIAYARHMGIPHRVTGKIIAATRPDELPALEALHRRGAEHGLEVCMLEASEAREMEPHVAAIAALHVGSTGIIDYRAVALAMAREAAELGVEVRTGTEVVSAHTGTTVRVVTDHGELSARCLVNCAGLHSDRLARACGLEPTVSIVPFRGEFFDLRPRACGLVNGLIYPVPDPAFPFLGVHLTKDLSGGVHAGPNAVIALSREGYRWRDVSLRDSTEVVTDRGFRALARKHLARGTREALRSVRKGLFLQSLQRLVPELSRRDLVRSTAGVRAQAVSTDGMLVDDFRIQESRDDRGNLRALHVLNAPSPAATASLEIGTDLARRLLE
ncbi:MAG: L-2-hydroxyglutarate oxidase [Microthrixaceae bacterium]|nr:L-2-hydroxyglutarate oxidase [Microthrixaceae bacterium]